MFRRIQAVSSLLALTLVFFPGAASAASETERRAEEFKSGIEKKEAGPAEVKKTEASHEKSAAPAEGKKKVVRHKAPHAKGAHQQAAHHEPSLEPEEALKKLLEGNKRYVAGKAAGPNRSEMRRAEIANGQHPFAVILSCSDSRVPPELLFDQGFGDLFVVRTAGNVVDDLAIGSIEYAVEHLGVKLIVVLGHERCGAVDATLKGGEAPGKIKAVVDAIRPAVERAKGKGADSHGCDLLCNSVKMNVKMVAEKLRASSTVLAEFMEDGMLKEAGAYYDLDSGVVSLTYKPNL
jgi:carbonic anhydrase